MQNSKPKQLVELFSANQLQFVRAKQLADLLSVNQSTIWRWRKKGYLPPPIKLGSNTVIWNSNVIEEWLEKKAQEVK